MEKETELFLMETIRELQNRIKWRGVDKKIFDKAEAFDILIDLMGIEVCHWVEKGEYELLTTTLGKKKIDRETYEKLRGAING